MTFDGSGNLWVLDNAAQTLVRINKATGVVLSSAPIGVTLGQTAGMVYDPTDGNIYVSDGAGTTSFYTVNTGTGHLTLVGTTGVLQGFTGLAATPAPGAVPVFVGAALLGARRASRGAGRAARSTR